jgi:dTDP-glucose 4,6-dehydratase
MRVLVTGGAGYIGSALITKLLDEGYDVFSIDNLSRGDYKYLKKYEGNPRLKLVVGDVCDLEKLEEVLKECGKVDAVVHLAAIPGLERCQKNPQSAILTNIYGTYNVLETARKHDVSKFVFTSSAAVYGNPIKTPIVEEHPLNPTNLYGVTKLAGEKLVEAYHSSYGLDTVILRFGNVYGVGLYSYWETVIPKFVKQALSGQPLTIYGDGKQSRDFIHAWDIIQAIMLAVKAGSVITGETFNVGIGKPTSVNAIAHVISKIFVHEIGKKVKLVYLPPRKDEPYAPNLCLLPTKIKNRLQFKPQWNIKMGIKQLIVNGKAHWTSNSQESQIRINARL